MAAGAHVKKVLLTGAGGFFGSHIADALARAAVTTLAPRRAELDLLDAAAVERWFDAKQPTHVIHAAGFVGGIGLNKAHPGRMALENLRMGVNVLAAASARKAHVSIVSTICVYPEKAPVPTPETAMYDGFPAPETAPYGLAKRELHSLADALSREQGGSYSYLVPTNLYGPRDHFDEHKSHVVPALIRRALEAKEAKAPEIVVWSDGSPTRDLLYVEDAARAVVASLEPRAHGHTINLGSGRERSIKEIAETIVDLVGYSGKLVWDATKPAGAPRRALDARRARDLLDFTATTELREGLAKTVAWYQEQRAKR
jgi:GDP-L-fucose synthase